MGPGRYGARAPGAVAPVPRCFLCITLLLTSSLTGCEAFNLDVESPTVYSGPAGSYFGYAVDFYLVNLSRWVSLIQQKKVFPPNSYIKKRPVKLLHTETSSFIRVFILCPNRKKKKRFRTSFSKATAQSSNGKLCGRLICSDIKICLFCDHWTQASRRLPAYTGTNVPGKLYMWISPQLGTEKLM